MKLPTFNWITEFDELRKLMGNARLLSWQNDDLDRIWQNHDLDRILSTEGLDVELKDVTRRSDECKGQAVIIYIRDQNEKYNYKFHICECTKINEMRGPKKNKGERYVACTRSDGKFVCNLWSTITGKRKFGVELKMEVCKLCLAKLNYNNYTVLRSSSEKNDAVSKFSIAEFLDSANPNFVVYPKYTDVDAPVDQYTKDWPLRSKIERSTKNYRCDRCHLDCSTMQRFLHAHHQDGQKHNNRSPNLLSLCAHCHALQPNHSHMTASAKLFQDELDTRGLLSQARRLWDAADRSGV